MRRKERELRKGERSSRCIKYGPTARKTDILEHCCLVGWRERGGEEGGRGEEDGEKGGRLNWRLIAGTDRTGVVLIGKGQGFI